MDSTARRKCIEASSERFRRAFDAIGEALEARFPRARPAYLFDMPGWTVELDWNPPTELLRGTMDPKKFAILMAEGNSGITLHFWYPPRYGILKENKAMLTEAGLKVMVGCLRFTRRSEYPVAAIEKLLLAVKK